MSQREFAGSKFVKGQYHEATELASLIREEIKTALKTGQLPKGLKTSVKKRSYAGGRSIDITVKALPEGVVKFIPEYVEWAKANPSKRHYDFLDAHPEFKSIKTEDYQGIFAALKIIGNVYNYDNSDPMTDYFDVNYYLHVNDETE